MGLPADAETYMLHRPPLRLIQSLLRVEDGYAEAQGTLNAGDVGVGPDGKLEPAVLLEMMAQTYAAAQGYEGSQTRSSAFGDPDQQKAGKPAELGYLVGVSDFRIEHRPAAGQPLLVRIKSSCSFGSFYLIDGQVLCEGHVVAGGTLKVWVQSEEKHKSDGL
jgi:predicted hotdog family 3-hydroxylacyl-ACP dehydratase